VRLLLDDACNGSTRAKILLAIEIQTRKREVSGTVRSDERREGGMAAMKDASGSKREGS
jgi:hypothetical protein